jgi:hypothetical protein
MIIVVAVAMLALFNAQSPRDWSANLPPGPASLALRRLSAEWWATTERWGLNRPRDWVSGLWADAKELQWRRAARANLDPMESFGRG